MSASILQQAINQALHDAMTEDDRVVVLGEDVGDLGGIFRTTEGLIDDFGARRVIDMPVSEGGILGAAVGMALYGLRPVAEVQFADLLFQGFEQIVSEMARYRSRSGGAYGCPLVIRAPSGGGIGGGPDHSQSPEAYLAHTPGLVVVAPSTAADGYGLLRAAVRSDDPVFVLEPTRLYQSSEDELAQERAVVPLGVARQVRSGSDVTVLTYGGALPESEAAADLAEDEGIGVDLLDLRTLVPMDVDAIVASVARTGRVVVVHEAPYSCGLGAEIVAVVADRALFHLEAPVVRVCGYDTLVPYALEHHYLPDRGRILAACRRVARF